MDLLLFVQNQKRLQERMRIHMNDDVEMKLL